MNPKREVDVDLVSTAAGSHFRTTHWSIILAAGNGASPAAMAALDKLCRIYWYPLYAYVRRRGYSEHDAQDLTQGYFAQLLRRESLCDVTPGPTKFRAFLLTGMKNFLADEYARATALKRGGGAPVIFFDAYAAEQRYQLEPVDVQTPETLFDQGWASTLLNKVLLRLEEEFAHRQRKPLFQALHQHLIESEDRQTYAQIAAEVGMTEDAVKKAAQRIAPRFEEMLLEEIAGTVATPAEAKEELGHLRAAMGKY